MKICWTWRTDSQGHCVHTLSTSATLPTYLRVTTTHTCYRSILYTTTMIDVRNHGISLPSSKLQAAALVSALVVPRTSAAPRAVSPDRPPARNQPFTCSRSARSRSSASRSLSPVLEASSTACRSWFSSRIASQISKESRCARLVGGLGEGVRLRVWGWLRGQDGVGVGGWGSGGG